MVRLHSVCIENLSSFVIFNLLLWVFCCKQKTAYEMRISDWSSDVCSSDLVGALRRVGIHKLAEDIVSTMTAAGYRLIENDPFEGLVVPLGNRAPALAAAARRVTELWAGSAEVVAHHFPQAPGRPNDIR